MAIRATIAAVLICGGFVSVPGGAAEFRFGPASVQNWSTDKSQLYVVGEIVPGDYDRFVAAIRSAGTRFFGLQLRSGGGNVQEALRIGRLARELLMYVYLPFPQHLQGAEQNAGNCAYDSAVVGKPVPCLCASACTLIFFGGTFRVAWEVYLHRIRFGKEYFSSLSPQEAEQQYQRAMGEIKTYFGEMGIDDRIYYTMLRTPSETLQKVTVLEAPELFGWVPSFGEWLTANCGTEMEDYQRGANCRAEIYEKARRAALKRVLDIDDTSSESRDGGVGGPMLPASLPVGTGDRYWKHNGSSLRLEADKATRRFIFVEPREGLRQVGVTEGMVAFEGRRSAKSYDGTAYVFSRRCGPIGYPVKGAVSFDDRTVTLKGYAPYVDAECRRSSGRDSVLVFELVEN